MKITFFKQPDLILVAILCFVLAMIIIPLPSILMDILITVNISLSLMIILMAIHIPSPVHFSTFPTLLLVTTLLRLGISISTTRLILTEGSAGKIVETFGKVVVGGNIIVGLVIFMIITIVQFLVISKGADRVAEVGARFTLDGLPGKQMSVDADVRAGLLDQGGAKIQRQNLEREVKLFGSMDGAMKFIKGDAIAGLVITAINLIGGISIGMFLDKQDFSSAAKLYSLMTIGDGLVAQIPALLISIASGIIVTRVTNPDTPDLGGEIKEQFTRNPRTIIFTGILIIAFGLIPGFPTVIFFALGGLTGGFGYYLLNKYSESEMRHLYDWDEILKGYNAKLEAVKGKRNGTISITLLLPHSVLSFPAKPFVKQFEQTVRRIETTYKIPNVVWIIEQWKEENEFGIRIGDEIIFQAPILLNRIYVMMPASTVSMLGFDVIKNPDFGTVECCCLDIANILKLEEKKIPYIEFMEATMLQFELRISENLDKLASFQSVNGILSDYTADNKDLIDSLGSDLPVYKILLLLKSLLFERVPLNNLLRILETALVFTLRKVEFEDLLERIRIEMQETINTQYAPDNFLPAIIFPPQLENSIRESIRTSGDAKYLALEPGLGNNLISQSKSICSQVFRPGRDPVIITQQDLRLPVYNFLYKNSISVPVLAYQEISSDVVVYPVAILQL